MTVPDTRLKLRRFIIVPQATHRRYLTSAAAADAGGGEAYWPSTADCVSRSPQMCSNVAVSTHMAWHFSHSMSPVSPICASRMRPKHAEHRAFLSPPPVRARLAPHDGQYTAPSNISPKHLGQLTVASVE